MSGYYGGGGGGHYGSGSRKKKDDGNTFLDILKAPAGLVGNLATDVKDAVVGLPAGIVHTVKDPKGSAVQIGKATWQTWSPLFHGEYAEFGHQLYDHPLAPLLDVATVFSFGASGAARGAAGLSKAGVGGSRVKAVAGLRQAKTRTLIDPTDIGRENIDIEMSRRAGARALQEMKVGVDKHLPDWFNNNRYERELLKNQFRSQAGTVAIKARQVDAIKAYQNQVTAVLKGGQVLAETPSVGYRSMVSNMYQGLARHAPHSIVPEVDAKGRIKNVPDGYMPLKSHGLVMGKMDKFGEQASKYEGLVNNFEKHIGTKNVADAVQSVDGKIMLVRTDTARKLAKEAVESSRMATWLWHKPTTLWKTALLGHTPRLITNNAVGNWFIYATRQAGDHALIGLWEAIRAAKSDRYARKHLTQPGQYGARTANYRQKWFADILGDTFEASIRADIGLDPKSGRAMKALKGGHTYHAVRMVSEKPVREAALGAFLHGDVNVRRLMKSGHSFDQAVDAAIAQNPELRLAAVKHVETIAGDYSALRRWEEGMRDLVPFYLWDRHILGTGKSMLAEQPARLVAMQRISNLGLEDIEEIMGEVPEFLQNVLPFSTLGLGEGADPERKRVFLTTSLNPFATISDLMYAAEGLTTGQLDRAGAAVAGNLNPIATGAAEFLTGKDILTGGDRKTRGGAIPDIIANAGAALPHVKLAETLLRGAQPNTASGNPRLYRDDLQQVVSSLLGVPIRDVHMGAAQGMAERNREGR